MKVNFFITNLTIAIFLLFIICCNSKKSTYPTLENPNLEVEPDYIFNKVDESAIFQGCENKEDKNNCSNQKIIEYLFKNIKYENNEEIGESTLLVSFVVEKDGSVSNIQALKGKSTIERSNIIEVLNDMPKWTPANYNHVTVRSRLKLPLKVHYK